MAQVDTQQLVEQVVFGVAVVSNGPAHVLFDEISLKEMDATHLEQAVFMTPGVSDGCGMKWLLLLARTTVYFSTLSGFTLEQVVSTTAAMSRICANLDKQKMYGLSKCKKLQPRRESFHNLCLPCTCKAAAFCTRVERNAM
ncbi:unnamed protein product [Miscanthus lutarioriparius]|uniref:Uncharacterized protein n=1 Tax=Miscanthus lutarioriparius TaxID=422564 RepID=A0A811RFK2_9POAL|nr:unnamed protein product [Miscanthus lutarioriparius]